MSLPLSCSDDDESVITLVLAAESQLLGTGLMIELLKKRLSVYWEFSIRHRPATKVDAILNSLWQCSIECFWENEAQASGNA